MCTKISAQSPLFWAIPIMAGTVPILAEKIQQLGENVLKQEDRMSKVLSFLADEKHVPQLLGGSLVLAAITVVVHDLYARVHFNRLLIQSKKNNCVLCKIVVTD